MTADPKIIDLINEKKGSGKVLTSLEYFPPRTEEGVKVCSQKMCINTLTTIPFLKSLFLFLLESA
jgi:hypothetical protein